MMGWPLRFNQYVPGFSELAEGQPRAYGRMIGTRHADVFGFVEQGLTATGPKQIVARAKVHFSLAKRVPQPWPRNLGGLQSDVRRAYAQLAYQVRQMHHFCDVTHCDLKKACR